MIKKQIRDERATLHPPKRGRAGRNERGIALLLTIFGLLLLTAVAMAMMFSSDAETTIAVNYRDKERASYAAFSGLQEARERLQPVSGDLATKLTNTPDGGGVGQVFYILNPNTSSGETAANIKPWDPTNQYFDAELCQENMFSMTGTPGVACTAAPAATGYQSYDESSASTSWKLAAPLDYKWVRITLKEDKNGPAWVNPAASSGSQACWDGIYQDEIPSGYGSDCQLSGGNTVIGLNITSGGSGYAAGETPGVHFSGGGGSGASAIGAVSPASTDGITSIQSGWSGGSGYTAAPNVTIATGSPAATFQAVVASSSVTGVTVNNTGSNYCYASGVTPTVNFSTSPGTLTIANAQATVTMSAATCIISVAAGTGTCTHTTTGKSYTITSISDGGGSGFTGTATFSSSNKLGTVSITEPGNGYTQGSGISGSLTITDDKGNSCTVNPTFTTGYQVASGGITVTSGGNYMAQPAVSLGGASVTGTVPPGLTALPNPWPSTASSITAINITSGGGGYTPGTCYPLTITPSNGVGSGATANACASGGYVVSGVTNLVGGSGFTTPPTVTIDPPSGGGTAATATATIGAGTTNTSMGRVYLLTALAVTKSGAKSMVQMEAGVRPPFNLNLGGALSLAGNEPSSTCQPYNNTTSADTCLFPNSNNLTMSGVDANSCGQTASPTKPAVGTYDNQSQNDVISAINPLRDLNYIGVDGSSTNPSVEQVYTALGGAALTPDGLNGYVQDMWSTPGTKQVTGPVTYSGSGASAFPASTLSSVTVINGNATFSGNPNGNGILVVTGTLTMSGDFTWNGLVLVIGQGQLINNGGGNMSINGAVYVANTVGPTGNPITNSGVLSSLGTPTFQWKGGGTNQIQYDHCKADALLKKYQNQPSSLPLQILSTRTLQF